MHASYAAKAATAADDPAPAARRAQPTAQAGSQTLREADRHAIADATMLNVRAPVRQLKATAERLSAARAAKATPAPIQRPNRTGLPDALKSGVESLSGLAMDDVRVHYNSAKPAQLQAHAYAQGAEIHIAPGQERHLPHEAWHVVQQKQGRVTATIQRRGLHVNDDRKLEAEADAMGRIAARFRPRSQDPGRNSAAAVGVFQLSGTAGSSWADKLKGGLSGPPPPPGGVRIPIAAVTPDLLRDHYPAVVASAGFQINHLSSFSTNDARALDLARVRGVFPSTIIRLGNSDFTDAVERTEWAAWARAGDQLTGRLTCLHWNFPNGSGTVSAVVGDVPLTGTCYDNDNPKRLSIEHRG